MSYLCFCPQNGWTALHLAAQEGKVDVVRLLTEAKAHVNIQTKVHVHVYTLCHVWSTDLNLSVDRGENMYTVHHIAAYHRSFFKQFTEMTAHLFGRSV